MRLTQIKLAGFKSFVDSTVVSLPSSLIGIVGPNGCGKSNVIDAVRWVMGESSAKYLRGESMTDVIFNGSSSRKPVAQASVELLFDNKEGKLGGEYAGFAEIAIRRVVTRDGQSSYFLNGTRCRRRDITSIFLGTGLGPRSYSIIEQGTISKLIEAKPEELRSYLEEAAGISKYKERRRETQNRMRHTEENLDRLSDLEEEIAKQVEKLKRQARAAERYQELKGEERELKAGLQALRWKGISEEMASKDRIIAENENRFEEGVAGQRSIETQVESHMDAQHEAGEQFNGVQGRFYRIGSEIAQAEQSITHTRSIREQQALDLDQISQAQTEVKTHLEADSAKLKELEAALQQDQPMQQQLIANAEQSGEAMATAEASMHEWQMAWDEFNRLGAEKSQLAEVEKTRISHIDTHLMQLGDRLRKASEEQQSLSGNNYEAQLAEESDKVTQLEQARDQLQTRLAQMQVDVVAKREAFQQTGHNLNTARSELQASVGRKASLEALQQAALGESDSKVTEWLETRGLDKARKLAQTLQVESGWEHAVELVLGQYLESVCVDDLNGIIEQLNGLEEGAVSFIDKAASGTDGTSGPLLSEKVSSEMSVAGLMAGVQFANSADEAMQMRSQLPANGSVITREGLWLGPAWVRLSRGDVSQQGVLAREQDLRDLVRLIDQQERQVIQLEADVEGLRTALDQLEQDRSTTQRELDQSNRSFSECRSRVSSIQTRLEQNQQRSERLVQEIQSLQEQIDKDQSDASGARGVLEATLAAMADVEVERDVRVQTRDQLQASLTQARETAHAEQKQAHDCALRIQSSKSAQESTEQAIVRARSQMQRLNSQTEELQATIAESSVPLDELEAKRASFLEQRLLIEKELADARKQVEDVDHEIRALETQRTEAEGKVSEFRSELEASRLSRQEFVVRSATLEEQIRESGFEPQAVFDTLPEEANESDWIEFVEKNGRGIQRLGAINLAAIDEFKEQSERLEYLNAQHQDLLESLTMLQNAISKIDKETRERFKETFDKVNAGFQEKFPTLFGGGKAYLELAGDDLLEAGVTVMARPPGKRNTSIHLLSGGEKALTAVALVFSIFDLNPAPFCMLDEVDAPLDEANVGRFGKLLQLMSERVQLIVITHNKATMEIVHQLSGVTMHEPGVSRLVTVDVDEASELVAV